MAIPGYPYQQSYRPEPTSGISVKVGRLMHYIRHICSDGGAISLVGDEHSIEVALIYKERTYTAGIDKRAVSENPAEVVNSCNDILLKILAENQGAKPLPVDGWSEAALERMEENRGISQEEWSKAWEAAKLPPIPTSWEEIRHQEGYIE